MNVIENDDFIIQIPCSGKTKMHWQTLFVYEDRLVMQNDDTNEVIFDEKEPINVNADEFYIEQIITNYFTNAIKHAKMINNKKQIIISTKEHNNKIRVFVFNTGDNIPQEELHRIWGRFYKIDSSRNRDNSGSGIGLSIVKAIQNNYQNEYGVENKKEGVEFYFDINM